MAERLRVAIVGSGNIGTDLLAKAGRSPLLEVVGMAGIDPDSAGLARAAAAGVATSHQGLEDLLDRVAEVDLAYDATSAYAHAEHAEILAARGIAGVDLTPAALGPAVIPAVNLAAHADAADVNLVTCGAQATVPVVAAIAAVTAVPYAEIVSTISASSAGPGTRANIDEFTRATARALENVGGAGRGKAIMLLNPSDPPILMRNTVYADVPEGDATAIVARGRRGRRRRLRLRPRLPADRPGRRQRRRCHGPARGRGGGGLPARVRRQPRHHDQRRGAGRRAARRAQGGGMNAPVRIVDTTLRDGSHSVAHRYTPEQVATCAAMLDAAGVWAIAVGHGDGLGAGSRQYGFAPHSDAELLAAAAAVVSRARLAVALLPGIGTKDDLRAAHEAGAGVVRVSTVTTEADIGIQHLQLARELGMEAHSHLNMASIAGVEQTVEAGRIVVDAGSTALYLVDSAGAFLPDEVKARVTALRETFGPRSRSGSTSTTTSRSPSPTASSRSKPGPRSSTSPWPGWAPAPATARARR